jgi:hypothetical protein
MSVSDLHELKAASSIISSVERGSKVAETRLAHRVKHSSPINRTEAGMQIDFSDEQPENAESKKLITIEGDSNVSVVSKQLAGIALIHNSSIRNRDHPVQLNIVFFLTILIIRALTSRGGNDKAFHSTIGPIQPFETGDVRLYQ